MSYARKRPRLISANGESLKFEEHTAVVEFDGQQRVLPAIVVVGCVTVTGFAAQYGSGMKLWNATAIFIETDKGWRFESHEVNFENSRIKTESRLVGFIADVNDESRGQDPKSFRSLLKMKKQFDQLSRQIDWIAKRQQARDDQK